MRFASSPLRARATYVGAALTTIAVGLLVHLGGTMLSPATRDVLGDALWAAMIAWWVGALVPRARLLTRGTIAYGICTAVELSQLYHTPTLDAVRSTGLGQLVLGSGFDVRDLVAYAAGVSAAMLLEATARAARSRATLTEG